MENREKWRISIEELQESYITDKEIFECYLYTNRKYFVEQTLLNSLSLKEVKEFLSPLYAERNILLEKIEKEQKRFWKLNSISKYFIECLNYGDRVEELEKLLVVFNTHLYTRFPSKSIYKKPYKKIDINAIAISEVIWIYTRIPSNLRRNFKCPLHREKTWSFKIYEATNSFYCFGCNKWWNAINFIAEIENTSTKEAFKKFIQYFNLI